MDINQSLRDFTDFVKLLEGDEKGEAQIFCDRFFRAFGHGGIIEANGGLEARIKFNSSGTTKFADCLWSPPGREGVLIEMKKRSEKDLESHFPQARDYWIEMNPEKVIGKGAQKPKYIVLCNFDRFLIYKYLSLVDEISIDDFIDRSSAFNFMHVIEKEPIFHNNIEEISKDAAKILGEGFKHLIFDNKINEIVAQRFLLQCVLALFSEDFGLLPKYMFTEIINDCCTGQSPYDLIGGLFKQMANPNRAKGGRYIDVRYFNGGIFNQVEPIELDLETLEILQLASDFNWKNVNPAIFGSLFESTMNEKERHKFGAHFTSEVDILKIVNPAIVRPWKEKIKKANTLQDLSLLLNNLEKYKVLDPACGCGNFLYVAYRALKDIEMEIVEKIVDNFSERSYRNIKFGLSRVSAKQFYGIDTLNVAVEVAKVTMMLGKELAASEWNKRISTKLSMLGLSLDEGLPLDSLEEQIICDDALFCEWPESDVIIGNPPYQSKNKIQAELGLDYINKVRKKYPDVPGLADYCVYWFKRAHNELQPNQRAGLVGTNTIRQNYSREGGLDYIVNNGGTIYDAISTQVWSGDAVVYVSIVNWVKGSYTGKKRIAFQRGDSANAPFEYHDVDKINSALSLSIDLTSANTLQSNKNPKKCFQGQTHGHTGFLLDKTEAEQILNENPEYRDVLFPYLNANEMLSNFDSLPSRYVIDFRKDDIFSANQYKVLINHVKKNVFEDRELKAKTESDRNKKLFDENPNARVNKHHQNFFNQWWRLSYARDDLMNQLESLPRYCVCGQVTKRPIFEFVSSEIHPNAALEVFLFSDDYSFGILQSNIHWEWFTARCSTLKGDPRYTSTTVFDSFPWPQNPNLEQIKKIADCSRNLREIRRDIMKRMGLSLRDIYRIAEETPSNPINEAQDLLNSEVFDTYGISPNEDVLSFLLDLNQEIYQKELENREVIKPGLPNFVVDKSCFISDDCIRLR